MSVGPLTTSLDQSLEAPPRIISSTEEDCQGEMEEDLSTRRQLTEAECLALVWQYEPDHFP